MILKYLLEGVFLGGTLISCTSKEPSLKKKLLTFNQTGQVIPQQHMVNPFRGATSLDDALNDLYSGEPMWFAPVGDTRYFDNSLQSFVKLNQNALNFVQRSIAKVLSCLCGGTRRANFDMT